MNGTGGAPREGLPRLVAITDLRWSIDHLENVVRIAGRVLPWGAMAVQLRDKTATATELRMRAERLRSATAEAHVRCLVNGALDLARDVGADGVHVPSTGSIAAARRALGASAIVTAVGHDDDDVRRAIDEDATAVLVSPIFTTPGKGPARGVDALCRARELVERAACAGRARVGILALGGVEPKHAQACADAGADGVAVIRALFDASASSPGDDALLLDEVTIEAAAKRLVAPFLANAR